MDGVSVLEYFRKAFQTMADGRADYDNLAPMAITEK